MGVNIIWTCDACGLNVGVTPKLEYQNISDHDAWPPGDWRVTWCETPRVLCPVHYAEWHEKKFPVEPCSVSWA